MRMRNECLGMNFNFKSRDNIIDAVPVVGYKSKN